MRMKRKFEWFLIPVLSLVFGAAAAVASETGALMHLSDRENYTDEAEVQSVLMKGKGHATVLFSDTSDEYRGRYIHRLRVDLYPHGQKPLDLTVTVNCAGEEGGQQAAGVIHDINPLYVTSEILRTDLEHVVSVELETADRAAFSVGKVAVDNRFYFNRYLFAAAALVSAVLLTMLRAVLYAVFAKDRVPPETKIRRLTVTAVLGIGLTLVICLPANKVGYDEETHLQAVVELASFPSGELHVSNDMIYQLTVTEYNNPEAQPGGFLEREEWEKKLSERIDYKLGQKEPEFSLLWNRVPSYAVMAVFMKAGKWLCLDWTELVRLARLGNLLQYAALIWLALKILPCGQGLMALLALYPQNLFMASTVSYDPFVTGCLLVGSAFVLRLMTAEGLNRSRLLAEAAVMLVFFLLGCLPKAVYAPLLLTAVLIPFRRTSDRRLQRGFSIGMAVLAALTLMTFVLPTLLAPSVSGDVRGGEVSEMEQLDFIFRHPLRYTGILLSSMATSFPEFVFGAPSSTAMGHLAGNAAGYRGPWWVFTSLLVLLTGGGAAAAVLRKREPVLRLKERLWYLLLCFAAAALIWTAMYVAFTVPGADTIGGVQGRYFIPLLFPLFFALGAELPAGGILVRKPDLWYYSILLCAAAAGAAEVFRAAVLPFCL